MSTTCLHILNSQDFSNYFLNFLSVIKTKWIDEKTKIVSHFYRQQISPISGLFIYSQLQVNLTIGIEN